LAVNAWRRFDAVDGSLQSLLLSTYLLIAVLPALLVMVEYLETDPSALATHLAHHYGLQDGTASLLRGVLVADQSHRLRSALLATAGALFVGLGFGRVLQSAERCLDRRGPRRPEWIGFSWFVTAAAASLGPVLAERRELERRRAA
jgi:hypothetical protein